MRWGAMIDTCSCNGCFMSWRVSEMLLSLVKGGIVIVGSFGLGLSLGGAFGADHESLRKARKKKKRTKGQSIAMGFRRKGEANDRLP